MDVKRDAGAQASRADFERFSLFDKDFATVSGSKLNESKKGIRRTIKSKRRATQTVIVSLNSPKTPRRASDASPRVTPFSTPSTRTGIRLSVP